MEKFKKIAPHFIVLLFFLVISLLYFSPVLSGKILDMPDIKHHKGMSKEIVDFRNVTGEEALWTNSMFSGMPGYQISTKSEGNLIQYVAKTISLGIPRPANLLFLYLLGFYILLLSLKIDYRLSAVGAIAFAFSSYFFIIIQAGHMTKAHAIAYVPMVIAAVLYTYRGKMLLGGVLTALTVALELYANHLQITYYLVLILLLIGLVQFIKELIANNLMDFTKRTGVLILAALLGSATSLTRLSTTMEYGKDSTRGKSELTEDLDNKTSGLDKDYATSWSYGIAESFTLLIPNFFGGASQGTLTTDSKTYQAIKRAPNARQLIKQLPLYWGDQPFTSGPTYVGAIVIFLFILGLFIVKSEMRIWLLLATILSIMLAWGKNFMPLTEFFLDYFPGYNKFRAVSMILVIAEFTIPLLGFIALNKFLNSNSSVDQKKKGLKLTLAMCITGGFCFLIGSGLFLVLIDAFSYLSVRLGNWMDMQSIIVTNPFDFEGSQDANLAKNGWPVDALQSDRKSLLRVDAWRSFIFISLTFSVLLMFLKVKLFNQQPYAKGLVILIVGFLVLADMWIVNKRYLNNDHFEKARKMRVPYQPTSADQTIYAAEGFNFDSYPKLPHFRVFNQNVNTFNDANTSYFHKSIGGYHGAKLKRYQELIEKHISKGNPAVINMLNTRYVITREGKVQQNPGAMGNAWFVQNVNIVADADAEIAGLNGLDVSSTAVVDERFRSQILSDISNKDGFVNLIEYEPNYLKYISNSINNGIVVFSEIYYEKGWNAYIDGELFPHFRANYVLRGMQVPAGQHTIEFKFEPKTYNTGETVSLASSILLILLFVFVSFKELKS